MLENGYGYEAYIDRLRDTARVRGRNQREIYGTVHDAAQDVLKSLQKYDVPIYAIGDIFDEVYINILNQAVI